MIDRKFMELGQPKSFKHYADLKSDRFEFYSFDSQIERLAQAWHGEGEFSQIILRHMSLAPFVGNLKTADFSAIPEVVLYTRNEVVNNAVLNELVGENALLDLAGMLTKGYKGGLRIATQFKKGHPSPEFVVPALGTTDRKLVFHLDRCGNAPAYSFLFENELYANSRLGGNI
jgi:hypothetical protein